MTEKKLLRALKKKFFFVKTHDYEKRKRIAHKLGIALGIGR